MFRTTKRYSKNLQFEQLECRAMLAVEPVGSATLINDLVPGDQTTVNSSQAVGMSGVNQVIVFEGKGPTDRQGVFAEIRNPAGETTVSTFQVNTTAVGDQHSPSVAVDSDGEFVVVWAGRGVGDKSGIFFRRYSATGSALGSETLVNTTTGGDQVSPTIAMGPDGSFVIAWGGVGVGDSSGVFMRRYSAAGVAAGNEVRINTTTTNDQSSPDIAISAAGNIVATWASRDQDGSDWGIVAQRFNSAGVAQGTEFVVNTTTTNSQMLPDVAIDPTGGFLIAWQSFGQDGSSWGIVGRRFTDAGAADGAQFVLNNITQGHQQDVNVAFLADGQLLSTWTTGTTNGHGWEIAARLYTAAGTADGLSFTVNQATSGANSGWQEAPSLAVSGDAAIIVWSGRGATDFDGVYAQRYDTDAVTEPNQSPNLAPINDRPGTAGTQIEVTVTATDPNAGDTLTFTLDPDNSPTGATITQTNNNTAIVRWTPTPGDQGSVVDFRVIVTDNGNPPLADTEDFQVTVGTTTLFIDLNGPDEAGTNETANFVPGGGAVSIVDSDLTVFSPGNGMITSARATLADTPNRTMEFLTIDTLDTDLFPLYSSASRTLTLTGTDTAENYARVLRTLRYNNVAAGATGSRTVSISVTNGSATSNVATASLSIGGEADLVAFAQALADAGVEFYGAAWSADTTQQRELFEDGGQFLPFTEVTNPNRTPNQAAMANDITIYPTWVFPDDTRLTGVQTLQTIAQRSGVAIPLSSQPFVAPLPNSTLLIGSPLHVPLDGYDPNGGPLTYTVTTSNPGVTAQVLTGNRSARINVEGFGDMVFELFEDRAPRATDQMIELAGDDFYEDIIFHRVVNGFVIQGGDPTGTGSGGSMLGVFDDQFHPDLQHNRTGLLSMAKTTDDTNDSQFFITEGPQRHLDMNHTIFGLMTEGELVRDAISNTATVSTRPNPEVVMEGIDIFEDQENAVVMLKAAPGTTGPVTITVTVTDQNNNSFQRTFQVNVTPDNDTPNTNQNPANSPPFLADIAPVSVPRNTTAQVQLMATDVENDPVFFTAVKQSSDSSIVTVNSNGLVSVVPPPDFMGTVRVLVGVGRSANTPLDTQLITVQFT